MNIHEIIDFFCEENDKLAPFIRTYKIMSSLGDISEYIKINFKPNINLQELSKELKVNIIIINSNLEFNCLNYGYDKYISLIEHKNGYEFAYISINSKILYIYKKDEIKNIKLNILKNYQECSYTLKDKTIKNDSEINEDDFDNSDDYEEIKNSIMINEHNTIEESIIRTEELHDLQNNNFNSIKDIIKKELGNDISTEDLNEIDNLVLTESNHIIEPIVSSSVVKPSVETSIKTVEMLQVANQTEKIVNGYKIPIELIDMELIRLNKMLKKEIIVCFQNVNPKISFNMFNKYTKEKLIEMIKN